MWAWQGYFNEGRFTANTSKWMGAFFFYWSMCPCSVVLRLISKSTAVFYKRLLRNKHIDVVWQLCFIIAANAHRCRITAMTKGRPISRLCFCFQYTRRTSRAGALPRHSAITNSETAFWIQILKCAMTAASARVWCLLFQPRSRFMKSAAFLTSYL